MNIMFFSSVWMILLECHESPAGSNVPIQNYVQVPFVCRMLQFKTKFWRDKGFRLSIANLHYTIYGIKCQMCNNDTCSLFKCMLVTLMINNFIVSVISWFLTRSTGLTNILVWVCTMILWGMCLCYIMIYKLTKVYINDTWY